MPLSRPSGIRDTGEGLRLLRSLTFTSVWSPDAKALAATRSLPFSSAVTRPVTVVPSFSVRMLLSYWSEMTLLGAMRFSMRSRTV